MASFEEEMDELEEVIERLEVGGLPLEESVGLFERGVYLTKACKGRLSSAESRIQVLLDDDDSGILRMGPLDVAGFGEEDEGDDRFADQAADEEEIDEG